MKKATACLLAVALVVGLLPTMALAAAYTVVSNETLKIENWDQYNGKSIALNDGSTLDLSGVNSNPSSNVYVQIYGGTVTIKGNPNVEFDTNLRVEVYGTKETGSTTIKLENFRRTDNAVLLFFQSGVSENNITIEYSGTNKAGSTDSSDGSYYSLGLSYEDNVSL